MIVAAILFHAVIGALLSWTDVDEDSAIDVEVPGGSVVLFSANLLHGTADNEDPERTRFSTAWHYVPGDIDLESFPQGGYEDRFTVHSG